ncbi:GrpB family protein [Paenibacillus dokdonensis]|uniref:GrpB family protein n=1 Tax=Paenibacillus dokdonensis TaxID=2567944 RepID=UPI0010A7B50E|nr:GrpB family protein [Paenibacillus dokdonensis]
MEQVIVSEYDPQWATEFVLEKAKIMNALGELLLGIEHIGSTSVPGLGAKPIIDIMVGINELNDLNQTHITDLARIGYQFINHANFPDRRFFRRGEWRAGTHHLHVYQYKGDNWNENLLFRNYLVNHPEALNEYIKLKKDLEKRYKNDRAKYTEAKGPFIRKIIEQAVMENK